MPEQCIFNCNLPVEPGQALADWHLIDENGEPGGPAQGHAACKALADAGGFWGDEGDLGKWVALSDVPKDWGFDAVWAAAEKAGLMDDEVFRAFALAHADEVATMAHCLELVPEDTKGPEAWTGLVALMGRVFLAQLGIVQGQLQEARAERDEARAQAVWVEGCAHPSGEPSTLWIACAPGGLRLHEEGWSRGSFPLLFGTAGEARAAGRALPWWKAQVAK